MNRQKIKQLLAQDEGFKLDFKLKLSLELESEKKEFVKDVIAIANTPDGRGYILFGIEDKTKAIVGIEEVPTDIEERIQQIIVNRSVPPVPVKFELEEIEEKTIGILTIFKSMQVPHQMLQTGAFYVRRGSTTDKATRHEIASMLQQYGMLSFENVPCRQATLEALDSVLLQSVLGYFVDYKEQDKLILSTLGIIAPEPEKERYYPTYGGLLLFGKNPQDFIAQAVLEINYKGKVEAITGNITTMLKIFQERMQVLLPEQYPIQGLLEVVTNAMIHRDYWNNTQYIEVRIEEETLTVTNPTSCMYTEIREGRVRINPWLYSRLLILGQKGNSFHLGIGLSKAKALFENKKEIQITTHLESNTLEVILPGVHYYKV
ncbi:transcriptional regulator [Sporanaerobium hydrogeniformans]|uniref:Transcriptional regulator n=1 Tax=Sporanaerobium hydrogeniformans TaxID=3072179 RepID=A0AC61DCJ7_9FIRM|nr:RNA-binding domain-containing protein [Sporanaerobium hydrogeniformans]PHV71029.1 transcriptional regulator [Sporanaerobium hydrogeniformans]